MPSAANVKIDKQVNQENALAESSQNLTPLRQAITIIEHKIRNLEKRKTKLESYRELQNAGKELNADQKTAVAKFGEVLNTLDFARDLCKQFLGIASSSEKEAKKLAKKEAAVKYQAELARLREILLVQDALNQMGNESVRDDFLNGRNGAAQLTEADLKLLDDFYPAVTPKHEAGNPTTFTNEVQSAAEHLLAAVDGKPKDVFGGTYSQIKEILGKIHESGYFDQAQVFESFNDEGTAVEAEVVMVAETNVTSEVAMVGGVAAPPLFNHQNPPPVGDIPVIESLTIEARAAAQPPPTQVPLEVEQAPAAALPPQQQVMPPQAPVAAAAPVVPPPEQQIYYQPTAPSAVPPPQQQQTPRPITEMLGTGSFFFLQESEIDPIPEQIPSQTFTNQNFSGGPPPPAAHQPAATGPLPPHFAASIPQQPPMGGAAPVANHQPMQPVQAIGNNGLVEDGLMGQPKDQQQHVVAKEAMPPGPPRTAQPYYQDNGYSRQQQRGQHPPRPRPVNARH